jgi:predicted DCC family thiol-disulfide oxidoreductase YuxK
MKMNNRDILLLDGECGLCNRIAVFLKPRLGKNETLIFITNESEEGQDIIENFPQSQQDSDTVYLVRNGVSYTKSAAAIRCLLYLKWYYKIFYPFFWIVPIQFRDLVYAIISKNRHRIFSKPEICIIPSLNK